MHRALRRLLARGAAAMLAASAVGGQPPTPTLAQLAHRRWSVRDGAPAGTGALAQTRDGFLWIGAMTGLFRFDGVRFERFMPPAGEELPAVGIVTLAAFSDGTLWVGYAVGGLTVISDDGRVVNYGPRDGLPLGAITNVVRDSAGTMWLGSTRGLVRRAGARWQRLGREFGFPGGYVADVLVDRRGTLWVSAAAGLFVLRRGATRLTEWSPQLVVDHSDDGSVTVREAPDGAVWGVSLARGLFQVTDTAGRPLPPRAYYAHDLGVERGWSTMTIDRHGYAWGAANDRLVRVALPIAGRAPPGPVVWDTLALPGLPIVLQDREGTIWASTETSLDQLREPKVTAVPWRGTYEVPLLTAEADGAMWAGSVLQPLALLGSRHPATAPLPPRVSSMARDAAGDLWIGGLAGLWRGRRGRFSPVAGPAEIQGAQVAAIAHASDGTLWVSGRRRGVFRRRGATWSRYGPADDDYAIAMAADDAGRTWLAYGSGRLVRDSAGVATVYGGGDGLRAGSLHAITLQGPRVWVGGEIGVAVADAGARGKAGERDARLRFHPILAEDGPIRVVSGIAATRDAVWLRTDEGVVRIAAAEVEHALRDSTHRVRVTRLDARDGIAGAAFSTSPSAVEGTDGRVWFAWSGGMGWVDPSHLRVNRMPPPVLVRGLSSGGRTYPASTAPTLPRRTTALSIAYTALALAVPERVAFRYRLVGLDTAWQDVGGRREAFYTNLGPGAYRFEVTAANEDGVWAVRPAALEFTILPTFTQTTAFRALCLLASVALLWAFVVWRQRRVATTVRARSEAVLAERMRVARELHDTLLSDMAAMAMRLDAAATQAERDPQRAAATFPELRDQARRTLDETRSAVTAMRATAGDLVPLAAQLAEAARRVFVDTPVHVEVRTIGTPKRLAPAVESETLRIATEALVNARKHADCRTVTLTCAYGNGSLAVTVRDDGHGFDAERAAVDRPQLGHWGLVGMRERAAGIGGSVAIDAAEGKGTSVQVRVPVASAEGAMVEA